VDKYLDVMYAPDRLLCPLRRAGRKGEGRFERVTWDEALAEIAGRLNETIRTQGGAAIWPYLGCGNMGFLQGIAGVGQRLWNKVGASVHLATICSIAGSVGTTYTLGSRHGLDPEAFAHAKLILLWGTNPLTTGHHFWEFAARARRNGARIVAIDPVRTRTAERCDEHVPIRPGTDAALALGLLHVVVEMAAEDRAFIAEHTKGWDQFRQRILEFPPERVARITGLPIEQIASLGRRLATTRPTAIRTTMGIQRHAGGGMAVRTIMAIPGVTGDWRYPGGGAVYSTGDHFGANRVAFTRSDLRPAGTRSLAMTRLGDILLGETDPPVSALIVCGANPAASNPAQHKVRRGLSREDLLTVVIDHFQTDTVDYADFVLPTTMQPEHADIHNAYGNLYLMWNEPAVPPPGECLPSTEIFRRLARHMGLTDPCLFDSDDDLARALLHTSDPSVQGITLERLKERGWVRLNYPSPAPAYPRGFPTPSGKIEFFSERAAADGHDPLPAFTEPLEVTDERRAAAYPLVLITPASHYFLNSMFGNVRTLGKKAGPPRIWLHPTDAARRQLEEGVRACVFNDRGEFQAIVTITDVVQPGVAVSPKGYWPKLTPSGTNANATVDERDADMGQGAVYHDTRVDVRAVTTP
jgi:anaerobic selenocysteine-containing dehydrogenase